MDIVPLKSKCFTLQSFYVCLYYNIIHVAFIAAQAAFYNWVISDTLIISFGMLLSLIEGPMVYCYCYCMYKMNATALAYIAILN